MAAPDTTEAEVDVILAVVGEDGRGMSSYGFKAEMGAAKVG